MGDLLSTAYLPPITYMALWAQSARIQIDSLESYSRQSYRNRCRILHSQGVQVLSVPVERANSHSPIRDIRLSEAENWRQQHWRSLQTAYSKSPYFLYYQDELKALYDKKHRYLWDLNQDLLLWLTKTLHLQTEICWEAPLEKGSLAAWPSLIDPKSSLALASTPSYIQTFSEDVFVPHLSIVDLLFNSGNESLLYLQKYPFSR